MSILVTGGAGFIGSHFVLDWFKHSDELIINVDKLTYAGNHQNLQTLNNDPRHVFVQGDINDGALISSLLNQYQPRAIIHFAAESHVDRSIHSPHDFIETNVIGTHQLLTASRAYLNQHQTPFRFIHISTDEVYGSLNEHEPAFTEEHPFKPNSPYSASKAASDHLVRAYFHTYGVPTIITHCSNNYGPQQFPEKLVPLMIHHALSGKPLPIYGDGKNVRDWLYVTDHCDAIRCILDKGIPGETYNIGGNNEMANLDIVGLICKELDRILPRPDQKSYTQQISFVTDRPGHDKRYAINSNKMKQHLQWQPRHSFNEGMNKTIEWFVDQWNTTS